MTCEFLNLTVAWADDELDDPASQWTLRHVATCPACQAELATIEHDRKNLREAWRQPAATPALREQISFSLDQVDRERDRSPRPRRRPWLAASFRWGALAGVAGSVLVTAMALTTQYLRAGVSVDAMVDEHGMALRTGALTQVISSDHHTVKPWFAGRADVSPAVSDHRAEGFALLGGRVAEIHGERVAVMVYRHGDHTIDLYASRAQGPEVHRETDRYGYHVACWRASDIAYCAVGDAQWSELRRFQALVQAPD